MQKNLLIVLSMLLWGCSINGSSTGEDKIQVTENIGGSSTSIPSTTCGIAKGDSIEMTKRFYNVSENPLPFHMQSRLSDNYPPGSYYRFVDIGVWVFFDPQGQVDTVRYDAPFSGSLDGVYIGEKRDVMIAKKGKPDREFEGMLSMDKEALEEKINGIVDSRYGSISKDELRTVLAQIDGVKEDYASIRNRAYVYLSLIHI